MCRVSMNHLANFKTNECSVQEIIKLNMPSHLYHSDFVQVPLKIKLGPENSHIFSMIKNSRIGLSDMTLSLISQYKSLHIQIIINIGI